MESSIAEFLMRQLASEQLPTSHACEHDARHVLCVRQRITLPNAGAALWSAANTPSPTRRPLYRWNLSLHNSRCHRYVDARPQSTYLLGLLAMIKCSICSYQCDN